MRSWRTRRASRTSSCSMGTALTPGQVELLTRYAPRIALAYDVDAAGQGAATFGATELTALVGRDRAERAQGPTHGRRRGAPAGGEGPRRGHPRRPGHLAGGHRASPADHGVPHRPRGRANGHPLRARASAARGGRPPHAADHHRPGASGRLPPGCCRSARRRGRAGRSGRRSATRAGPPVARRASTRERASASMPSWPARGPWTPLGGARTGARPTRPSCICCWRVPRWSLAASARLTPELADHDPCPRAVPGAARGSAALRPRRVPGGPRAHAGDGRQDAVCG